MIHNIGVGGRIKTLWYKANEGTVVNDFTKHSALLKNYGGAAVTCGRTKHFYRIRVDIMFFVTQILLSKNGRYIFS